jgi:hypothetical protein
MHVILTCFFLFSIFFAIVFLIFFVDKSIKYLSSSCTNVLFTHGASPCRDIFLNVVFVVIVVAGDNYNPN